MKRTISAFAVLGLLSLSGHGVVAKESEDVETRAHFFRGGDVTLAVLDQGSSLDFRTCFLGQDGELPGDSDSVRTFIDKNCTFGLGDQVTDLPNAISNFRIFHQDKPDRVVIYLAQVEAANVQGVSATVGSSTTIVFVRNSTEPLNVVTSMTMASNGANPEIKSERYSCLKAAEFTIQYPRLPFKIIEP
jgi:hypothetical protein